MLQGQRCTLRMLTDADAPSLALHANDEAVWRNLFDGFPRPYTLADAQGWCDAAQRGQKAGYVWAIVPVGSQDMVGCIGLRVESGWLRCSAEVGYWIGQTHWRQGITSEALKLVTQWAWATLPELTRIYAPIFAWNEGSQAVARSAGFVLEGTLKQSAIKAGVVIDRVQYATYRSLT
ncbi:MAG: GNAT family N-acetyltransferase [Burkholderiales bacterium]